MFSLLFQFIHYLPAAVCLFWMAFLSLGSPRGEVYQLMMLQLANLVVFHLFPSTAISYLVAPSILPLSMMFLERLRTHRPPRSNSLLWIIIPVTLFTARLTVNLLGDSYGYNGDVERQILDQAYWIALALEALAFLVYLFVVVFRYHNKPLVNLVRFFKGKSAITPLEMQLCVSIVSVPTVTLLYIPFFEPAMPFISVLMAVILFFFGYASLFCSARSVTLDQSRHLLRYNYTQGTQAAFVESLMDELVDEADPEALHHIQAHVSENLHLQNWQSDIAGPSGLSGSRFQAVEQSWEDGNQLAQFQHLMIEGQLFLQPSITLEDVAKRMGTNKTYVSKMVNSTYNQSFPELLNTLRIDYAEQYLLEHRDAKQKDIAKACGFLSASAFNSMFKKVTGLTPKMWLSTYSLQALHSQKPENEE